MSLLTRTSIRLKADPHQVILKFLDFGNEARFRPVIDFVNGLDEAAVSRQLDDIRRAFAHRHVDLDGAFRQHAQRLAAYLPPDMSERKMLLAGAYFTHEYSIQAAALFNPSIIPHPDQSGTAEGELRFIMSLRATGEGHISSVALQSGTATADGQITLASPPPALSCGQLDPDMRLDLRTFLRLAAPMVGTDPSWSGLLTAEFSLREILLQLDHLQTTMDIDLSAVRQAAQAVFEENYEVAFDPTHPENSRVLFPRSRAESNGMEDVRFVRFEDDGMTRYIGTYTAYNGRAIRPQLIETTDFLRFRIRALSGAAVSDKGMALFPQKVNGRYVMAGRQGGRDISIMYSDDLYHWDSHRPLQTPQRAWDIVQLGNCGSPVLTDEGWLLLTHAVGPMRRYVLGLTLLDRDRPERVIATLDEPLLEPNAEEREGYVPNVLYTCGMLEHAGRLIIPYAMSDSAIGFATARIGDLLDALLHRQR